MSNTYIKFSVAQPTEQPPKVPGNIGRRTISPPPDETGFISNPDFHDKIKDVVTWFIEFENDSYFPEREIGLDANNLTVMIMPWRTNYGYWTDNDLVIQDFKSHFQTVDIPRLEFEQRWKAFEAK